MALSPVPQTPPAALPDADLPLDRVMVVYAHPDDPEFFSGGLLALLADAGKSITYVLATSGDKGSDDPDMTAQRLIEIREEEQRNAAAVMGSTDLYFLRNPDGELFPDLNLRKQITRVIRQHKPDIVITCDPATWYFRNGGVNHPDHRAIGEATMAAVYPTARDRHNFPDLLLNESLEPHKVRKLYLAGTQNPNARFNITSVFDRKMQAILCHKSQVRDVEGMLKRQRDARDPDFPDFTQVDDSKLNPVYTESYRVLTLR